MSLEKMTIGDIQDLTYKVEYLAESLKVIYKNAPNAELLLVKFQQMNSELKNNVEFGIKGLEASLKSIDYDQINDHIVDAIKRRSQSMTATINSIKHQSKEVEANIANNKTLLNETALLVDKAYEKMNSIASKVGNLPLLNQQILIAASSVAFVSGLLVMYAASYITWLPKPYFATPEQALLLQMVKDKSLVLNYGDGSIISIHIDHNAMIGNDTNKIKEKQ